MSLYFNKAIAKVVGVLVAGVVIGATVNGWRLSAQLSDLKAEHAQELTNIATAASIASKQALEQQAQSINALAELDRKYTNEIEAAQLETDQLRSAVASGERRLRIQANCPATTNNVPNAANTASVDDAAGARLTESAERNYWILRDRIALITNQVSALQSYIKTSCLKE